MSFEAQSVVVALPTYNNEETIADSIEMVLSQQRTPDRVVICDKSDDATAAVARSYQGNDADVTIEVIKQQGDGVANAYNEILEHVRGEYDLFIAMQTNLVFEDDWIAGHIELHETHPDIDMVTGDNKANDPTDREVEPDEGPYYVGRNFSAKSGVLERVDGWDENFLRGEDWDMRIRLSGAGVRVYARTAIGYTWQQDDPYVTLSKAKRKPTSITFLSKFGTYYLRYHPSHVVADLLSLGALATGILAPLTVLLSPPLAGLLLALCLFAMIAYTLAHNVLRGAVDESPLLGPPRKQLLNGIATLYAAKRIATTDPDWNMAGFDPAHRSR